MKLKTTLFAAFSLAALAASTQATFAQTAPETRSGSTMDRDGGPTGLDPRVFNGHRPIYAVSPYANYSSTSRGAYGQTSGN